MFKKPQNGPRDGDLGNTSPKETRCGARAILRVKNEEERKEIIPAAALSSQKAALDQNFPSQPQARCPKAKPGALISHSVFPCLSRSLSFVIIEFINIDWSSESQHRLYPCARTRFPGEGPSDGETAPDPPDKARSCPFHPGILLQNPTPAPSRGFDPAFPAADQTPTQKHLISPKIKVSSSVKHRCAAWASSTQTWRLFKAPTSQKKTLGIKVPKSQVLQERSPPPELP